MCAKPHAYGEANPVGKRERVEEGYECGFGVFEKPCGRHVVRHVDQRGNWSRQCGFAGGVMKDLPEGKNGDRHDRCVGPSLSCGHGAPTPRRADQRRSQIWSAVLTTVAMIRINKMSPYMRGFLKSE